jgi:hypothetical protein
VISKEKCSIMFSINTRGEVRAAVMQSLDIGSEVRSEMYLELPIYTGKQKI